MQLSQLTKDDIKHLLTYALSFIAAYALYMANSNPHGIFSWAALAQGLTTTSFYHIGANMVWGGVGNEPEQHNPTISN